MMPALPGFYGKIPLLGDFVSRRLPRHFIEPWDSWLQSAFAASREQLGVNEEYFAFLTNVVPRVIIGHNSGQPKWRS